MEGERGGKTGGGKEMTGERGERWVRRGRGGAGVRGEGKEYKNQGT